MYLYGDAFSSLRPKERIWDASLADKITGLASDMSFEKVTNYANSFLHRSGEKALCKKTIEEFVERTGRRIDSAYAQLTDSILSDYAIETETGIPDAGSKISEKSANPSNTESATAEEVEKVASRYNQDKAGRDRIPECFMTALPEAKTEGCVYIYVDDVLAKHQKESRSTGSRRTTKFVSTTVISIQHGHKRYHIAADGMQTAFKRLMAFLLESRLMEDKHFIFITDGATEIKEYVQRYFGFRPYTLYLDWHHLQKKCYQLMSSALKGGKKMKGEKDSIERELYGILWAGNTKGALEYIAAIDTKYVKLQEAINSLIKYITNKQEHIPCYAIRKGLGLPNSSNPVEKANDLIVARRQKGKGMAWSKEGSHALAAITVAGMNNERQDILSGLKPRFAFAA